MSAVAAVVAGGFTLGLTLGVVLEDPDLVFDHLLGRTEIVELEGAAESVAGTSGEPSREAPELPPVALPGPAPAQPAPRPPAPAPAARGSAVPQAPSAPEPAFSIQVGAFREPLAAQRLARSLREGGFEVSISQSSAGGARWRVRVGPFASRGEAERVAARLHDERRLPTWILGRAGH